MTIFNELAYGIAEEKSLYYRIGGDKGASANTESI
jgi:hypothetical protein